MGKASWSFAVMLLLASTGAHAADVTGWWVDESHQAGILLAPCGESMCGSIGWLKEPLDPASGKPKFDRKNGDPALRQRPICGLRMLWGFVRGADPGSWTDGTIYDPESGNTYSAKLTLQPDGSLKLRGYIGISLFGRSEIWTRPDPTPERCVVG